LLVVVFVVWMMPALAESRRSITSRGLLRFPFTTHELFGIRLGSIFFSPLTWIVGALSLALVFPLTKAPHPLAGMLAQLLFLLLALFSGLTFSPSLEQCVHAKDRRSPPVFFSLRESG
jgi:hypothetical protein